jgi:hypothetical protein
MSRTPQPPSSIATAADYADAMLTTRAARTIFAFALILILLLQLVLFIVVHFTSKLDGQIPPQTAVAPNPPATSQPVPQTPTGTGRNSRLILKYAVGLSDYFGLIFSILLCLMLLLLLNVMLIGRLIGVSHVTAAFIFSLIVLLLVFPWQAILNNQDLSAPEFKVPGVLYTFDELVVNGHFGNGNIIQWFRFMLAPIIAIVLVFTVLLKSGHGLRMALGEEIASSRKPKDEEDDLANDRNMIR